MRYALAGLGLLVAVLGLAVWLKDQRIAALERERGRLQTVNETCSDFNAEHVDTIADLEEELNACVGENNATEADLAVDRVLVAEQNERLERELAALENRLADATAGDECAARRVPADAVDGLRAAAARAHRAGRGTDSAVGADSG